MASELTSNISNSDDNNSAMMLQLPHNIELFEKFNAAFYDAQQPEQTKLPLEDEILESFDESYFTNIDDYERDFNYTELSESLDNMFGIGGNNEQFSNFFVQPPFVEKLPPISSITRSNNTDFANFLRDMPCDSLDLFVEVSYFILQKQFISKQIKNKLLFYSQIFKVTTDTF